MPGSRSRVLARSERVDSTRARIIAVLRRGEATIDDLATALALTPGAVRFQLSAMQRDGTVRVGAHRRGATKPARLYALTANAERRLSRAYVPLLDETLRVLGRRMSAEELRAFLQEVGRGLAAGRGRPGGSLAERARAASEVLDALGGACEVVVEEAGVRIVGRGCPIAETTAHHPAACAAVEALLAEVTGLAVRQCCDHAGRPACGFALAPAPP